MAPYTPFSLTNFLNIVGYLSNSGQCPALANYGGYPTCSDYQTRTFDFVIVGAGPGGCTLANRLSENPNIQVLLLEEGPYPSLLSEIPLEFIFLQRTNFDYNITIQQPNMFQEYKNSQGRMCQGRALGGGSTVNAMIDIPGVRYDYDRWAQLTQDQEWSFDTVKPYFDKVSAMVETTTYTSQNPTRLSIAIAADELGYSVNNPDDIIGYHDVPIMIVDNQRRNSIADAYLKPVATRSNLCVVVNKSVKKVIIDPASKIATGVEVDEENGPSMITANKEIIITAGAINSAKLAMLSGIGPKAHLTSVGINVIEDLPVGQLLDHLYVPIFAQTPGIPGFSTHEQYIDAYCTLGKPMNNIDITNFIGMVNTNGDTTHPNVEFIHAQYPLADQVFLPHALDIVGYSDAAQQKLTSANADSALFFFVISNLHPKSQGTVLLNSADPFSTPIVHGNYLNDLDDSKVLIDAILTVVVPMLDTLPFAFTNLIRFNLPKCDSIPISGPYYKSRDYWACYLRHFATSELHPMATCRMGSDRTISVLDSRMRVHGIGRLRIVDSSAMPTTISGHPTVPVVMMAEKAATFILSDNGLIQ